MKWSFGENYSVKMKICVNALTELVMDMNIISRANVFNIVIRLCQKFVSILVGFLKIGFPQITVIIVKVFHRSYVLLVNFNFCKGGVGKLALRTIFSPSFFELFTFQKLCYSFGYVIDMFENVTVSLFTFLMGSTMYGLHAK